MTTTTPKQVLAEVLGVDEATLADDTKVAGLGDSLDLVECLIELEDEFAICINDDDVPGDITVGQLVGLVEQLRSVQG